MGANSTLFLKISEQEYLEHVPQAIRESVLNEKIYSQSVDDFDELFKDSTYKKLYKAKKEAAKALDDHTHYLREQRRKTLINK